MRAPAVRPHGFTLVELTVVILIVSLIFGGMTLSLSTTQSFSQLRQTGNQLTEIRNALLGFAAATGRLPCPASDSSAGQESFCRNDLDACGETIVAPAQPPEHGRCSHPASGFLPAVSLGLPEQDGTGFLRDAWGTSANRIRYAIADTTINEITHPFTRPNGMKEATLTPLSKGKFLMVCSSALEIREGSCAATARMSDSAVAVIFSLGRNAPTGGRSLDEAENLNGDALFVSHPQTTAEAPGGEFDDLVTWIAPGVLFNRMIAAGKLP